jgi:inorganic pyrophosphatase/exopolyphosphatase
MKAVGIICDITPIIEERLGPPPEDKFKKILEKHPEISVIHPNSIAGVISKEEREELSKYEEEMKERKEKIKDIIREIFFIPVITWTTDEVIDYLINRFKEYKIPYIIQVYDGITNEEWVKERLRETASAKFWVYIVKELSYMITNNMELLTAYSIKTDSKGKVIIERKDKQIVECIFFIPDNEIINIFP